MNGSKTWDERKCEMTVNPERREDKSPKTCSGLLPGVPRPHDREENPTGCGNAPESRRQSLAFREPKVTVTCGAEYKSQLERQKSWLGEGGDKLQGSTCMPREIQGFPHFCAWTLICWSVHKHPKAVKGWGEEPRRPCRTGYTLCSHQPEWKVLLPRYFIESSGRHWTASSRVSN